MRDGHAAEVLRVVDGDTFQARVRIWPGMNITTKVRLRGTDGHHGRRFSQRCWRADWRGAILAGDGKASVADALPQHIDGSTDMRAPPM